MAILTGSDFHWRFPMKIVLALDADRGAWPVTTDGRTAQAGAAVVGPRGLLSIVETALGLRGPPQPQAVRLACWRAKLSAADTSDRFWHASFGVDPFATARTVLGIRDALVEAGWDAGAIEWPPPRLADLAAAEAAGPVLPPGESDRLRAVLNDLATEFPPEPIISNLVLLDSRPLLPPGLGKLVSALEASGTQVSDAASSPTFAPGDLGVVQSTLDGAANGSLHADGSFAWLRADTEGAAAEVLADWLTAAAHRTDIVIVATRPTGVLDAALHRRHLPRLGISAFSPLRGVIQALPLTLATRWQPFDAVRMLELLQLRNSPLPREVRMRLVGLLPECPGRGGPEWRNAIAEGLAAYEERIRADAPEAAEVRLRGAKEAVALWLEGPLADPIAGMPIAELAAVCKALTTWAARLAARGIPLAGSLAGCTSALLLAVREAGLEQVPRLSLERLLDTLLAEGERDPVAPREASEWATVESPGAAWGPIRTLVWWGFDPPPLPTRAPWDRDELDALASAGCVPWSPAAELSAASASWRRPLRNTTERALLVSLPGQNGNLHPLAHEFVSLVDPVPACRPVAEQLVAASDLSLVGSTISRVSVVPLSLPEPRAEWSIPPGLPMERESHSATAVEHLLGCPFAWTLKRAARLYSGRRAEIAEGERLIGLLAHRLASELFPPGAPDHPDVIRAAAVRRLRTLVEEAAAPLLQPGAATERVRMLERLPVAVEKIAELLGHTGLTVVGAEARRTATDMPEHGESFNAVVDLLLVDGENRPALLDLKWTRAGHRYRHLLENGLAIQLAAYAKVVGAGERAAYFLLADAEAFSLPGSGLGTAVRAGAPSLSSTWTNVVTSRQQRMAAIRNGILRALGVEFDAGEPDPDGVATRPHPPCAFCEFGRLCGVERMT